METSSSDEEKLLGELVPQGGGDPIPLRKERLMVGRRENCDVILRFGNVSSNHCELTLESGYWFVKDLGSRNGTRLNGYRITKKRMDPGDTLSIAKRDYKAKYSPAELGAEGPPPDVDVMVEIMSHSLLEGAGLARKTRQKSEGRVGTKKPESAPAADEPGDTADRPAETTEADQDDPTLTSGDAVATTDPLDDAVSSSAEAPPDENPNHVGDAVDDDEPDEYKMAPE
jgi:pSer/pThr/pTyr-binding forkhead associated (FHA) protein